MARVLLTSGPTRQYLDPVRYLTNASSGRMGSALASALIDAGHEVVIVSGPVAVKYPAAARVHWVVTTDEMLHRCDELFGDCDGAIGAAAPCDYRPTKVSESKIAKDGRPLTVELIETPDVIATLGQRKRDDQWVVGFALETDDHRFRATVKLERKHCDLIVSNDPTAIDSETNRIEVLDRDGRVVATSEGPKADVAGVIVREIDRRLTEFHKRHGPRSSTR